VQSGRAPRFPGRVEIKTEEKLWSRTCFYRRSIDISCEQNKFKASPALSRGLPREHSFSVECLQEPKSFLFYGRVKNIMTQGSRLDWAANDNGKHVRKAWSTQISTVPSSARWRGTGPWSSKHSHKSNVPSMTDGSSLSSMSALTQHSFRSTLTPFTLSSYTDKVSYKHDPCPERTSNCLLTKYSLPKF
jgi:hypothetical protein